MLIVDQFYVLSGHTEDGKTVIVAASDKQDELVALALEAANLFAVHFLAMTVEKSLSYVERNNAARAN